MWTSGSNGISVGTAELDAYEGSNYASLFATSSQSEVKLITDMVDASTLTAPILSYAIVQPSNSSGFVDSLRVYYRNSATDAWTLLVCDKTPTATWLRREVALTGVSLSSIQFAFEYNYANGRGVGLDDIYLGNMQTCVTPVFGATYQITDTSATLTWADDESHELGYSLKVSNAPITDFTQTALVEATSFFSPYTITGLSANTTYYCYVKARCSATDESEWSAATIFTTLCSPVNLPFSENFNSYTATTGLPSCWTSVMNFKQSEWGNVIPPANIYPSVETSTALGAAALRLTGDYFKTTDGVNRTTSSWYATPMINVANLSNTQISFWMNSASRGNHVEVGVMSDPTDIATFRVIADVTPMTANVWEEVIVPFDGVTESDYKFIAFLVEGSGYIEPNIFYIDDIVIEDIPACSKPSLIRSTVLGSDSVVLNWTAAKVSSWEIKVSTTQMSDLTVAADIYNGTVTSKPATIRNLTPATDYYVYIRSMCSPANSEWSNVYKFTTLCAPESVFPYVVDFTTMSIGTFPICWNRNGVGNFVPSIATFWNNDYTAQINSLYLNSDEAGVSYAVTPAINSTLNSLSLKMNISTRNMGFCGYLEIGSMTDPEDYTTFSAIDTLYLILDDLVEYNVSLERSTLPGLGNHIALRHSGVNSNFGYYITRLEIDSLPTCASAQNISLTSLTSTSAAIGWNADPSVLRWAVKVSKTNHANPESGAGDVYQDTISTTNFSLSGLAMGVNYYVFVKSICADETSYWQRYAITTPCSGIESFPFIETFSDYGNSSAYPTCWNRGGTSGNLSLIHNTYELTFTPTTSEYNYNPVLYAVLPQLVATGVNVNDLMISLNYKVSSVSAPLEIGVMTSVLDTASFVTVATLNVTAANNYEYFAEVSLDSYTGTGKYIAVRSRVPEGMYSVTARIDDVRIDLIPTCSRILSTEVVGFGEDYINFSWEQRSEEALWEDRKSVV